MHSDIKFHENRSSGSSVAPCKRTDGRTDGQTDMTKLIAAFHNFVKTPKNLSFIQPFAFNLVYCVGLNSSVGIATGYGLEVRDGIPVGARFSAPFQTGPGAYPASYTMDTGSFPGVKSGRGVTLTPKPLLVPWSRKSRAILLLFLWAYGLYRASLPVQGCTLLFTFMHYMVCIKFIVQFSFAIILL